MVNGDVIADLGGVSMETCKYLIMKRSGGRLILRWDRFKYLTVNSLMQIENIDEYYIIVVKNVV